jgi:hypothetical protein
MKSFKIRGLDFDDETLQDLIYYFYYIRLSLRM